MRKRLRTRIVSILVGAAMCLSLLPVSAMAAQEAAPRAITYTVRLDGDSLKKTTINSWYDQQDVNQGPAEQFNLSYDKMYPGLLSKTVKGLIQIQDFPDLGNVEIKSAKLHMNKKQDSLYTFSLHETASSWNPDTVTWNTAPYVKSTNYIYTADSSGFNFDITNMVKNWTPGGTYGMQISLDKQYEELRIGDSEDYIEIQYTPVKTVRMESKDMYFASVYSHPIMNQAHENDLTMWDNYMTPGAVFADAHALLRPFNLPTINGTIKKATLHLKLYTLGEDDPLETVEMRETTTNWISTVTWSGRPTYSDSPICYGQKVGVREYTFDVTSLTDSWYAGNNYGLAFILHDPGKSASFDTSTAYIDFEYYN